MSILNHWARRFIEVWECSANIEAVCQTLQISKTKAYARASYLRRKSVPLRHFRRKNVYTEAYVAELKKIQKALHIGEV